MGRPEAEAFIKFQDENVLIPPDDVGLPPSMLQQRFLRRLDSSGVREDELREIFAGLHISEYMRDYLIQDTLLKSAQGFPQRWVYIGSNLFLGLNMDKNKLGIFDSNPEIAHAAEVAFFDNEASRILKMYEEEGHAFTVSRSDWENHLHGQSADA